MKDIYCDKCGILTAKLATGSSIKPNAIMICDSCNTKSDDIFNSPYNDSDTIDNLKNIFGMN